MKYPDVEGKLIRYFGPQLDAPTNSDKTICLQTISKCIVPIYESIVQQILLKCNGVTKFIKSTE